LKKGRIFFKKGCFSLTIEPYCCKKELNKQHDEAPKPLFSLRIGPILGRNRPVRRRGVY
jgi:hypothetical protein